MFQSTPHTLSVYALWKKRRYIQLNNMENNIGIKELGFQIKIHREYLKLSQTDLANNIGKGVNRSNIAHLEQGLRIPDVSKLTLICNGVNLPKEIWASFTNPTSIFRLNFEAALSEFVGTNISSIKLDEKIISVLEKNLQVLFNKNLTPEQSLDYFNSIIIYYGIKPINKHFFSKYLKKDSFRSITTFNHSVIKFQKDAIRLFSTILDAFNKLNINSESEFNKIISQLDVRNTDKYTNRTEWDRISNIENADLPYLGYIAASKVKNEQKEREILSKFLEEIIEKKQKGIFNIEDYSSKMKRKMDSLLRKFNSTLEHGLFSPMFNPDISILEKEVKYISPEKTKDIDRMEKVQIQAYNNLSNYLTADYLDVYVATSMRNDADFISVNNFVENLFINNDVRQFKLRYFNPTQSWIEDRVAKGLVEALMLKRADICIYMAQKDDTFGKDSEASVTLGQGKPVIIYVPKLYYKNANIDTEQFGHLNRDEFIALIKEESEDEFNEIDESEDNEALHSRLLHLKLAKLSSDDYCNIVKKHWADFDLENEFNKRIDNDAKLATLKKWFSKVVKGQKENLDEELRNELKDILVGVSIRFEKRATIFREVHPLALQVILSSGVLNGILVVRSVETCAKLVRNLIENNLDIELEVDEHNYRLIEKNTLSTIRVISRHQLISNAFKTFYTFDN